MGFLKGHEDRIYALFRIFSGLAFAQHGFQKLFGWFGGAPEGAPAAIVYSSGGIELIGGLLVAVGLFTGPAAFICSGTMAAAYFIGHALPKEHLIPIVNGGELAALYCFGFLLIAARGSGIWSADAARGPGAGVIRPGGAARGLAVAVALGCGNVGSPASEPAPRPGAAAADETAEQAEEPAVASAMAAPATESRSRAEALGGFLEVHWTLPVPAQGPAPEGFSALEAALDPASCGACHPQQLAEWQTSLHADAYSPGFAGQLIEGSLAAPDQQRNCQTCHTPLEEQQLASADGAPNPLGDPALREAGLVCAGCHVRAHERFGPPRRADAPTPPGPLPHDGFSVRPEYQESRFCGPCHQFYDREGPSGKPIQNTHTEWRESPHAARGETCQSCHMPDRAHLWRGIHDEAMVRGAVRIALETERLDGAELRATLRLTSHGVGHAFPTYVTPRVLLQLYQADARDEELPGTRTEHVIGRQVDFGEWVDVFDTRVPPEGAATLSYAKPRADGARALIARVVVDPDAHYRGVFAGLLPKLQDAEARRLIGLALERASASSYVLEELRRPLP